MAVFSANRARKPPIIRDHFEKITNIVIYYGTILLMTCLKPMIGVMLLQFSVNPQQLNPRKNHEETNVCVCHCRAYGRNYSFRRRMRIHGKLLQILQELL